MLLLLPRSPCLPGSPPDVLAYTLWYVALQRRSAAKLTIFTHLTPVFGVVLSAAVLGEAVGMTVISGGVVVVGELAFTNLK